MTNHLDLYKVFYYTAKLGSITKAANELSITQPAVSQAIKQLESLLGVILFKRTSKGIQLTMEGELLYPYVEQGYESIVQGERKIKELLNLDDGEIRIGASDMTLKYYLLPYLEKYHSMYPKIKVIVANNPTPETINALRADKIDFCVVSSPLPDLGGTAHAGKPHETSDLVTKNVKEIHDIFVAGSAFNTLNGRELSYSILKEEPVICLEKNTSTRKSLDKFLANKGIRISPEFELATSDMIVGFSEKNLGIGYVMEDFAAAALENGALFKLHFEEELPPRHLVLAYKDEKTLSPAAKALIDLL